ncbi:MAG: Gx transporter family protein [Wujia sp.]
MKKAGQQSKQTNNRLTALCGVLIALAMILSYLENLVPIHFAVPGIKLGLANVVTIIALQKLGVRPALVISVGRIVLSGILFGNLAVIIYSLAGALLSILVMCLVRRFKVFSITGVSVCGAVAHNFGQLMVAACVMENAKIMYYMAVLAVSGTIAGVIIGIFAGIIMHNIHFSK